MATLRWLLPALVPAALLAFGVYATDKRREPPALVVFTFLLGALLAAGTLWLQRFAGAWAGLDIRASVSGEANALLFLFFVVAPVREGEWIRRTNREQR